MSLSNQFNLDLLQKFEPISLKEMDGVKLMNRTDTKFIFGRELFDSILTEVLEEYRILEVESKRISRYRTLYYDTERLSLYIKHQNGELNRYKIRHRTYVESNLGFLEVKFKNNKGRTIKNRIKSKDISEQWNSAAEEFLKQTIPFEPNTLHPTVWVNYSRMTLVNKTSAERLTIDLDLEFVNGNVIRNLSNMVIAEVKQEKRKPSPFLRVMKKYHIREGGISKYCMAIALTTGREVKKNNFKEKLLSLKKLINIYDYVIANY